MCLVTVPRGIQKIEPLSSSEKKWQAIKNLVHIILEYTLIVGGPFIDFAGKKAQNGHF